MALSFRGDPNVVIARNAVLIVPGQTREWPTGNPIGAQFPGGEADAAAALIRAPALPEVLNTRAAWLPVPAPAGIPGATLPAGGLPAAGGLSDLLASFAATSALRADREASFPAQGCRVHVLRRGQTRHKTGHEAHPRDP